MKSGKLGYRSLSRAWLGRPGSPSTEPSSFPISGVSTTAKARGKSYTKNQLALKLFEQPTSRARLLNNFSMSNNRRRRGVINDLVDAESLTGKERNKNIVPAEFSRFSSSHHKPIDRKKTYECSKLLFRNLNESLSATCFHEPNSWAFSRTSHAPPTRLYQRHLTSRAQSVHRLPSPLLPGACTRL